MRVFKNTWFSRFAKKAGIDDGTLRGIVDELEAGKWDADLGSGVYKKRIAKQDEGKRGGYRIIVFFKNGTRTFFSYGFAKSVQGNISEKEVRVLRETSKEILNVSDAVLKSRIDTGNWIEITD
ncbi:MAG: type II toxin-antitoxin system RelE/ParE family toxin [Spirochaetaceae bacterium]|nr:type II toxin-antitoxin system RelE/ParE family toxin [Spirochaetaceae bacterium]